MEKTDITDLAETEIIRRLESGEISVEDFEFLLKHPEFQHHPVKVREFITSEKYLNAGKECWPAILEDLEDIFSEPVESYKFSKYTEVIRDMGIGSGKSFRIRYMFCYITYRLLCFESPQEVYGLAKDSTIALVNSSVTANQAKKIIFADVISAIRNSPWFQKNGQPDPNVMSEQRFPKSIVIFPGSSSETAPIGYNVFFSNVDEAAFFVDSEATDAAQTIYDAAVDRRKSRFDEMGLNAAISSPRYEEDFIERKIQDSRLNPHMSGKIAPTWENRPRDIEAIKRGEFFLVEHPRTREMVKIPNSYAESFKRDTLKAWRNFGAVASLVLEPYFQTSDISELEQILSRGKVVDGRLESVVRDNAPYFAHFDLAVKRDACGFALGHPDSGRVVIDAILRIVCEARAMELQERGQPYDLIIGKDQVDLSQVREIIFKLIDRGFDMRWVSYDQFQSIDSRQILEARGIMTKLISVDRDMQAYDTLKDLINTKRFLSCQHNFFLLECRRLEIKDGKKVDHPPKGSKDCADAVAGVCRSIAESFDEMSEVEEVSWVDEVQVRIHQEDV